MKDCTKLDYQHLIWDSKVCDIGLSFSTRSAGTYHRYPNICKGQDGNETQKQRWSSRWGICEEENHYSTKRAEMVSGVQR